MRAKNTSGGGAKTTQNGLLFEQRTDLLSALKKIKHLRVAGSSVYYGEQKVALVTKTHKFYKAFLNPLGVDEKEILSKKLLPDGVLVNCISQEVFIIEKKFQEGAGSVDEKLQTCDFKLKQYQKLLKDTPYTARFIFLLSAWFAKPEYEDVKAYIESVSCYYYFNELPLSAIKLDEETLQKKTG